MLKSLDFSTDPTAMTAAKKALRARLRQPGLIVAPGVYDRVSLRLADSFGFDALYMTGFGAVASHLGLPDAGLATYSDRVGRVTAMAGMARTPLRMPIHDETTKCGTPLSAKVGTSGSDAARLALVMPRPTSLPDLTKYCCAVATVVKTSGICPPSTSTVACPPPL